MAGEHDTDDAGRILGGDEVDDSEQEPDFANDALGAKDGDSRG